MVWSSGNKKSPLIQATLLFAILVCGIVLAAVFIDFSSVNLGGLLFLSAFLSCAFIAKNLYDVEVAREYAEVVESTFNDKMLFASKELYSELYQNSPIPYILLERDGKVRSANLAAFRLFEYKQGDLEGMNIFKYFVVEDPSHFELVQQKFQNGISVSDELVRIKQRDNDEVWALLSLFCFKNTEEDIGLLTLVDITKQKQIERAKAEFVSLASHQLRTPIAAMKWSVELLQMDNPDSLNDRQKKYLERLLTGTRRLALLVDDFLRVSRFELGTFQPEYTEVVLHDLITDIISEQTPRIEQKKLTVKTFFDADLPSVMSDANLLRMICTNLLSNAVKYTREGGTVHVGYTTKDSNLVLSVADNGMGIPPEDQERVFTKLFRASNAARTVPDGTGLGLYIVKEAVTVLGGKITFTSMENSGTTFDVVLPLRI